MGKKMVNKYKLLDIPGLILQTALHLQTLLKC